MLAYVYLFIQHAVFSAVVEAATSIGVGRLINLRNLPRFGAVAISGTLLTIPYVWFVFPTLLYYSPIAIVLVGESFAIIVEMFLYKWLCYISYRHAFILSLMANIASYTLGKLVW